ncbi:MAG: hypothetical protein L0323_22940 [Planctomycetes bacterium]|nr:hypothetical protein [Planctomycetota bacterium]
MNPLLLALLSSVPSLQEPQVKIAPPKGSPEALAALTEEVIKDVERVRGLAFKRPVPKHVRSKEEVRNFVKKALAKEMPAAVWGPRERFYKRLGLLPADCDFAAAVEEVLVELIGGFYDPDTGEFVVVGSFGPTIDRFVVAHELTHALDDQHFDLKRLTEEARNEEDRSFVVAAVAEGSGMLVAQVYLAGRMIRSDPGDAAKLLEEMKGVDAMQTEQLRRAPPYLQRMLLVPYLQGMSFLQKGYQSPIPNVRPKDLDRAFRTLPRSAEQILHPEKYWFEGAADEPVVVTLPDLSPTLGAGWKKVDESTLGEMFVALLVGEEEEMPLLDPGTDEGRAAALEFFSKEWTNDGAEGWGGDRFAVYAKDAALVGVWFTVWDTAGDAEEFEKEWAQQRGAGAVRKRENDRVAFAVGEGVDRALLDRIVEQALREAKTKALERPENGGDGEKPK